MKTSCNHPVKEDASRSCAGTSWAARFLNRGVVMSASHQKRVAGEPEAAIMEALAH